jgi:pimeloyl-ACP methyl ester carboxylesterase
MFLHHARKLVEMGPYKCILLDLPGHGTRMDDELSLDSAISTVLSVAREHAGPNALYVGGSLGSYIGMELLGRHPSEFKSAVLMMCGQNTGAGSGIAAKMGLWGFKTFIPMLSSATILNGIVSAAKSNKHLNTEMIFDTSLRPGAFFGQGLAQVKILEQSNPRESLPKYKGKVLFINGSKDHRDSENIWTSLCNGQLIVYDDADHFFSHDNRYFPTLMNDMHTFFES